MQWVQIDRPCIILPFIHSSRKNLALEFWSFGVCVHSTRMILLFPHYFLYHLCPWIRSYTVFLVCSNYFLTITTSLYMESIRYPCILVYGYLNSNYWFSSSLFYSQSLQLATVEYDSNTWSSCQDNVDAAFWTIPPVILGSSFN